MASLGCGLEGARFLKVKRTMGHFSDWRPFRLYVATLLLGLMQYKDVYLNHGLLAFICVEVIGLIQMCFHLCGTTRSD